MPRTIRRKSLRKGGQQKHGAEDTVEAMGFHGM
jgi:hypothetical protein